MRLIHCLPKTVLNRIALFTGDRYVIDILKEYIDYDLLLRGINPERTLLYGPVQSGKTEAIVKVIQNQQFMGINKVLIIQNSLLVLKQYQQRLNSYRVPYHVVGPKSKLLTSLSRNDVLILMNNHQRYIHYLNITCKPTDYIVLMDECDMYKSGSHPVAKNALYQFYVTATPFHKTYREKGFFDRVSKVTPTDNYIGLKDVVLSYKDLPVAVSEFMSVAKGMMLINSITRVNRMVSLAHELSVMYPETPILVLNEKKWVYHLGVRTLLKETHISSLIDQYIEHSHIIFIANRLSLRGLSYTSSDYSRHLTHQYSNFNKITVTNCIQKMRMLGKHKNTSEPCTLYLGEEVQGICEKMAKVLSIIEKGVDKFSIGSNNFNISPVLSNMV